MTGPPAIRPEIQKAPPSTRANPNSIPVRLYGGSLIAHADAELADRLVQSGAGESFRSGPRRYLRLRKEISIPRTETGWDVFDLIRASVGDKAAAGYVAHKDRQSEHLQYQPPSPAPERLKSAPRATQRPTSKVCDQFSKSETQ